VRGKCRIVAPGKNAGFESDRSGPAAERERALYMYIYIYIHMYIVREEEVGERECVCERESAHLQRMEADAWEVQDGFGRRCVGSAGLSRLARTLASSLTGPAAERET